ncbi:MAG: pantetheine-phosphate adenylyltransferase [Alphaproteobacteria bacterium]|nr:MAG: pantetheine-phosphate adenylyltransferase [Alphaproteobacteria bacterium]
MRCAVYPGSFDPVTFGHLDIIQRASKLADRIVIGIAAHSGKTPLFTVAERIDLLNDVLKDTTLPGKCEVVVEGFDTLLIHFMNKHKAQMVVRGVRQYSDFEYEAQMSALNAKLSNRDIETVFLAANPEYQSIASRFIKQVAQLGGDVSPFVPPQIVAALEKKS